MRSSSMDVTSGEERCPVCDFAFSRALPREVREHDTHHRRYLAACDGIRAPAHRVVREQMMREGAELLVHGETLAERVRGAERQLEALFHEHLAEVLLGHASRRLDFGEFVTSMNMSGRLDGRYEQEVANELRQRYSDGPRR
ncbi:hypothetical protein ACN28E_34740 [Archangium lansingense]|uniref:hypothetical protein n=1 Tax=Archangium lansingense TaxID=2995310 RepID=UPI003B7A59F6